MRSPVVPRFRAFSQDSRGNFALIFGIVAPILVVGLAGALDYSNAVTEQQRTQAASDAAAIATADGIAAQIMNGGSWTAAQAQAIGNAYFVANAPTTMVTAQTSFAATVTVNNNVVTANVTYAGTPPGLLGNVFNRATDTIDVASVASATISSGGSSSSSSPTSTTSSTSGSPSTGTSSNTCVGSGSATATASTQHLCGSDEDDSDFMTSCDTSHATWYNLLSDKDFEINANCDGDHNHNELYQFDVLAGSHEIAVAPSISNEEDSNQHQRNRHDWQGDVTIDGHVYPATPGTNTYVDDASCGVKVTVVVNDSAHTCSSGNYVQISTPNYSMTLAYNGADDSEDDNNYGYSSVRVEASNPGVCGTPGGLWGTSITKTASSQPTAGSCHSASTYGVSCSNQKQPEVSQTCQQTQSSCSTLTSVVRQ